MYELGITGWKCEGIGIRLSLVTSQKMKIYSLIN